MSDDEKLELEFLRYFYANVGDALGPADDEIYRMYKQDFKDRYGALPVGYDYDDEDEDA